MDEPKLSPYFYRVLKVFIWHPKKVEREICDQKRQKVPKTAFGLQIGMVCGVLAVF